MKCTSMVSKSAACKVDLYRDKRMARRSHASAFPPSAKHQPCDASASMTKAHSRYDWLHDQLTTQPLPLISPYGGLKPGSPAWQDVEVYNAQRCLPHGVIMSGHPYSDLIVDQEEHKMAATDYYNSTRPVFGPQNTHLAPPTSNPGYVYPQPQQPQSKPSSSPQSGPPTPHYPPPPPYQQAGSGATNPNPYFPPYQQRNSFSHPQRPSQQSWGQPYAPAPGPYQQQLIYNPQQYPQQYPQPQYLNPTPHFRPDEGYISDPEPERHRHKHRHSTSRGRTSRSSNTDGFLGAAGGGFIGDMIFPGLGTLGGAVAGWVGGKDYGRRREKREERHEREQREWEEKWGHRGKSHERSRDRSHDSGGRSSHEKRRSG